MTRLTIPAFFRDLISDTAYEVSLLRLTDATTVILDDNKLPFFPAYTDHGRHHIENLLVTAVNLVPIEVRSRQTLAPEDGAVFIAAALLHDLAMHVREEGFIELVSSNSRPPLPWFRDDQPGHNRDLPWSVEWARFQQEAQHFTVSQLETLFGAPPPRIPSVAYSERGRLDANSWAPADYLLIGEFLRRHHARIAHEIATYGFPGLDDSMFPCLASSVPTIADIAGVVARSHNAALRLMLQYLEWQYPGVLQPAGSSAVYWMAILRIADYLQIDDTRAPLALLRLRDPRSPTSTLEWAKHGAVAKVIWNHRDPLAIYIDVSPHHTLETHLALKELLADLEREFDTSTAVLSELYGHVAAVPAQRDPSGQTLPPLRLARQRLRSNLSEPSLRARLPFIPERAVLSSADDLFRRLIRHIYGNNPVVAGRELLQNAVDAIRERRRQFLGDTVGAMLSEDGAHVAVEMTTGSSREQLFTVRDAGVGMTPEVVIDYYLRAGASYSPSPDQLADLDPHIVPEVVKAGEFGIGALAAFLLGSRMYVTTRHRTAAAGISFEVRPDKSSDRTLADSGRCWNLGDHPPDRR